MNYIENINFNKDLIRQRLETRDSLNHLSNNDKIRGLIQENIELYKQLNKSKVKPKPKIVKRNSEEKTVCFNSLLKRVPVSQITNQIMEAEEEFGEYLHSNDYK